MGQTTKTATQQKLTLHHHLMCNRETMRRRAECMRRFRLLVIVSKLFVIQQYQTFFTQLIC